jgi:hypothetical protein
MKEETGFEVYPAIRRSQVALWQHLRDKKLKK